MKRLTLLLSAVVPAFAFASSLSFGLSPGQVREEAHNQWLFKSLGEIQKIRVGTTRKEVDKLFTLPGGVQPMNPLILVYRKSPYIFVRVNYKTKRDAQGRLRWNANDQVLEISKPYLQHWTFID